MQQSLEKIPTHADRVNDALHLMGARNTALVPLLAMSSEEFDKLRDHARAMGAQVTEDQVKAGEAFGMLETGFRQMTEGLAASAAKPVLKLFADHLQEIEGGMEAFSKGPMHDLEQVWKLLQSHQEGVDTTLKLVWTDMKEGVQFIQDLINVIVKLNEEWEKLEHSKVGGAFVGAVKDAGSAGTTTDALKQVGGSLLFPQLGGSAGMSGFEDLWHHISDWASPSPPPSATPTGSAPPTQASPVSFNFGDAIAPAVDDLNRHIQRTVDSFSNLNNQMENPGVASAVVPNISRATATPGVVPQQTINVAVAFDPRESAQQFAAKVMPQLRSLKRQIDDEAAGAAMAAMARDGLGGLA